MAEKKVNEVVELTEEEKNKKLAEELSNISFELKRTGYYDEKRKKNMYEYHILENRVIDGKEKELKVKFTCDKKDIDTFAVLEMMFDFTSPKVIREPYTMKNDDGTVVSGFMYYVLANVDDTEMKLKVSPMKASDKCIVDLLFNQVSKEIIERNK